MIKSLKARLDRREDEGFTLIELMVVVLIIAILMAIAIPTFLSARNTANARAAQSNLRNAVTAQATQFAANNNFQNSVSAMQTAEPAVTWAALNPVPSKTNGGNTVYFETDGANNLLVNALGADGKCYYEWDANGQTVFAINTPSSAGVCSPAAFTNGTFFYDNWADAVSAAGAASKTGVTIPSGYNTSMPGWSTTAS